MKENKQTQFVKNHRAKFEIEKLFWWRLYHCVDKLRLLALCVCATLEWNTIDSNLAWRPRCVASM